MSSPSTAGRCPTCIRRLSRRASSASCFLSARKRSLSTRAPNTFGDSYFTHQAAITKKNGVAVPTTFFEQEESRGISAVVYSTAEEFNCRGNFGAGLILIHNPMAAAPLPRGYLPVGR